jgi:hypothetical protein
MAKHLIREFGAIVSAPDAAKLLGYRSTEALRQARHRCRLPVPMFKIPGRRGWFAAATAVAAWLDTQNLVSPAKAPTGTEGGGQTNEQGGAPWPDH